MQACLFVNSRHSRNQINLSFFRNAEGVVPYILYQYIYLT
jgi:hypothetical protein